MTFLRPADRLLARASRRGLLKGAAAGLVVGFVWQGKTPRAQAAVPGTLAPNAFIRVAPDNTVTVLIKHLEMGQGVYTGLSTIVAEELDADWAQMRAAHAPADVTQYANSLTGLQMTGGSTTIANSFEQLRKAGATARAMLVNAASKAWGAPASEIKIENGVVSYKAKRATFGEMAARAANLPVPADAPLKDPAAYKYIGKMSPTRLDTPPKVDGSATYALDVMLPGQLTAVVMRPPRFGAGVKSVAAERALALPGVKHVFAVPSGVAVVADTFWHAQRGRSALNVEWDDAGTEHRGSTQLMADYKKLAATPGLSARKEGDAADALGKAARTVSAEFEFPYLAHAPMEPLDCVIHTNAVGCEVWTGCQFHTVDQGNIAKVLGLKPQQVKINTLFAGGSFGRRANPISDFLTEAAHIAKSLPAGTPVKVIWTREDDIRGGMYRPMYYHTLKAGLDASGNVTAWAHTIVGQSLLKGTPFEAAVKNGIDNSSVEGAANLPYAIPNLAIDLHTTDVKVPVLWWRSVGSTHNTYATEAFADLVAKAANQDPLTFRQNLLAKHPRHLGVLNLAAEKAGWGQALGPNRARGLAVAEAFNTYVAQVVEISRDAGGRIKVDRVVCAVDCGIAVNPDVIRSQMEGGIAFGLGTILRSAITMTDGKVDQANFDTYGVTHMTDMPVIEVHIVPSQEAPTGVGEPGVPPLGPALANAILALTGQAVTKLPMTSSVAV
ncbi:MAG: xanthine dehydrogenase family protein molybdopterin-binding subunit [Rhodospirillaceae bacterium]|nr:xanthine dehydrogenase family protein molybdopterin-binding subunit [Rhodospirillaceae bacterium]